MSATDWRTRLARNRAAMERDLVGDADSRHSSSPVVAAVMDGVGAAIDRYARGRVLDAGCGHQPFRAAIERVATEYRSLDVERRVPDVDYVTDIEHMDVVPAASFDTVVCSEVLEHVPHPAVALSNLCRALRPGGTLIVSVPFLARLHEEPHDYYRYTAHGLRVLLVDAGLDPIEIRPLGSLATFLGHQASTLLVVPAWSRPKLRRLLLRLNAALVIRPARAIDRLGGAADLLPCGYLAVARRPDSPT